MADQSWASSVGPPNTAVFWGSRKTGGNLKTAVKGVTGETHSGLGKMRGTVGRGTVGRRIVLRRLTVLGQPPKERDLTYYCTRIRVEMFGIHIRSLLYSGSGVKQ